MMRWILKVGAKSRWTATAPRNGSSNCRFTSTTTATGASPRALVLSLGSAAEDTVLPKLVNFTRTRIGHPVDLMSLSSCRSHGEENNVLSMATTADRVLQVINAPCAPEQLAESIVAWLRTSTGIEYQHVLALAAGTAKTLIPRVAALLDVQPLTDVINIVSEDVFVRPIYAGNVIATVRSLNSRHLLTVRRTILGSSVTTDDSEMSSTRVGDQSVQVEIFPEPSPNTRCSELVGHQGTTEGAIEHATLDSARIIVTAGRGFEDQKELRLVEDLVKALGAHRTAIGATRALVDAGVLPNELQIGQTGKVVAPDLYIAIGVSGALQHLAGMRDSRVIIAINSDPEAPIFRIADYGFVGDLKRVIPELIRALSSANAST